MSIINEALKKTGQFIHENEAKNNPATKIIPGPRPWLIYILILLAGILLSKFIFDSLSQKLKTTSLASTKLEINTLASENQNRKIETAVPVSPTASPTPSITPAENNKTPETNFVLNGIFFSDNDGYALVNNQIIRENDSVDGAKVIEITENTVELDNNGKLINLSTRR